MELTEDQHFQSADLSAHQTAVRLQRCTFPSADLSAHQGARVQRPGIFRCTDKSTGKVIGWRAQINDMGRRISKYQGITELRTEEEAYNTCCAWIDAKTAELGSVKEQQSFSRAEFGTVKEKAKHLFYCKTTDAWKGTWHAPVKVNGKYAYTKSFGVNKHGGYDEAKTMAEAWMLYGPQDMAVDRDVLKVKANMKLHQTLQHTSLPESIVRGIYKIDDCALGLASSPHKNQWNDGDGDVVVASSAPTSDLMDGNDIVVDSEGATDVEGKEPGPKRLKAANIKKHDVIEHKHVGLYDEAEAWMHDGPEDMAVDRDVLKVKTEEHGGEEFTDGDGDVVVASSHGNISAHNSAPTSDLMDGNKLVVDSPAPTSNTKEHGGESGDSGEEFTDEDGDVVVASSVTVQSSDERSTVNSSAHNSAPTSDLMDGNKLVVDSPAPTSNTKEHGGEEFTDGDGDVVAASSAPTSDLMDGNKLVVDSPAPTSNTKEHGGDSGEEFPDGDGDVVVASSVTVQSSDERSTVNSSAHTSVDTDVEGKKPGPKRKPANIKKHDVIDLKQISDFFKARQSRIMAALNSRPITITKKYKPIGI